MEIIWMNHQMKLYRELTDGVIIVGDKTYEPNGKADVDTDYTNHGNLVAHLKIPHKHKWDWSNPNKPKRFKWF